MTEPARGPVRWPWLVIAAVVLAVFWPALRGQYVYDDEVLIVRNLALQHGDLGALLTQPLYREGAPFWRPLTALVLWAGHHLGGAAAIHAFALVLHAACSCLVFALAARMLALAPALWVALLFAVHPVQVESVAWCAAINDPLWVLGALLAMRAAVRWRDAGGPGLPWQSAGWVLAALLSKETGIAAAPLVCVALCWVPGRGGTVGDVRWRRALTMLIATGVLWCAVRLLVLHVHDVTAADPLSGRLPTEAVADEGFRTLEALQLLGRHLVLLVLPLPATPFRPLPATATPWIALAILAAVVTATLLVRRLRASATVRSGLALLLLPLLPSVLGYGLVGTHPVNDRYLYAAVSGLGLLAAGALPWRRAAWLPWLLWLPLVPIAATTWTLVENWRDADHLSSYALAANPDDPEANVMAGQQALQRARAAAGSGREAGEDWARAKEHYRRAEANSGTVRDGTARRTLSHSRLGLAWCLMYEPRRRPVPPHELVGAFQAAVEAGADNAPAWVGLGIAHGMARQYPEADQALRRALAVDPWLVDAWHNLGYLQLLTGRRAEARQSFEQALRRDPDYGPSRAMLDQLQNR